ncbi:MAG TPA: hypothetical protein VFC65_11110 [Prolixibacteraceae bacterium]|nr:hypothetical protein [Prolixibacteraceae bacterium]
MANQSETGHAKNVANFGTLTTVVNGFGAAYNPSKQTIVLTALVTLSEGAKNSMRLVNGALGQSDIAKSARELAFEPLSKLATRIINAIRSSDTSEQIVDAAQSLVRKIQGKRATAKKTEEEKAALLAEGTTVKEISSSQMSFDNRMDSLDRLVQLLGSIPQYSPNEVELQVGTLTDYYNTLSDSNTAATEAKANLSNARLARNEILYKPVTGLVDIALSVKTYTKSLFGATSAQYKQVSGLAFKAQKS